MEYLGSLFQEKMALKSLQQETTAESNLFILDMVAMGKYGLHQSLNALLIKIARELMNFHVVTIGLQRRVLLNTTIQSGMMTNTSQQEIAAI